MGSWIGHITPGLFFLLVALWTMCRTYRRYFISRNEGKAFQASVFYPLERGCCKVFHRIDAMLVLIMTVFGIFMETALVAIFNGPPGVMNAQHSTMYLFFGIPAFLEVFPGLLKLFPNQEDIRYVTLFLAYVVEGLLFKFHLLGRNHLDEMVHVVLVYAIFACSICTLVEIKYKDNLLLSLSRSFFTSLQGTWFWHVAFILYNPIPGVEPFDPEDHSARMMIPVYLAWHIGGLLVFYLISGIVLGKMYLKDGTRGIIANGTNGVHGYKLLDEEEKQRLTEDVDSEL